MDKVYSKPKTLTDTPFSYCSGCGHSIVHRLLAEIIDEMELRENIIAVAPVGCSVIAYDFLNIDFCEAAHGRAAAVATGIKRVHPDKTVISYQGDGDLAAIGLAETIHAANRGENITVVFINNAIYGMTGGQMAPTTPVGMKTATSPKGRSSENEGFPIRICELLSTLEAPSYIIRTAVHDLPNIIKTKKALKHALSLQVQKKGYSFVEVLSQCPTNLGMKPLDTCDWIKNKMSSIFPLGVLKNRFGD